MRSRRAQGRPARTDDPVRLVVRVPSGLKKRLRLEALKQERDMGQMVAEALDRYLPRTVSVTVRRAPRGKS